MYPQEVELSQLVAFPEYNNYRPPQPLNGRSVQYLSLNPTVATAAASVPCALSLKPNCLAQNQVSYIDIYPVSDGGDTSGAVVSIHTAAKASGYRLHVANKCVPSQDCIDSRTTTATSRSVLSQSLAPAPLVDLWPLPH